MPCRYSSFKAILIGFVVTFFPIADVPVFWPILLMYWFVLFFVTMKRQIKHMIKYRYLPFSMGKKVAPPTPACPHAITRCSHASRAFQFLKVTTMPCLCILMHRTPAHDSLQHDLPQGIQLPRGMCACHVRYRFQGVRAAVSALETC